MLTLAASHGLWVSHLLASIGLAVASSRSIDHGRYRSEVGIPDIPGYVLLKCDFHMHTVFSDGNVWPTVRVDEAWRQGLDALAITDHIEYRPFKTEVVGDLNRSYELARGRAQVLDLILIKGSEITRKLPPGHFNGLFLTDARKLETPDWRDAIKAANDQGAFVFWNHPNWEHPQNKCEWFPEHTELYEKGLIKGIEISNSREYYPEVHRWCLEKKLTMMGNSDSHDPTFMVYDAYAGEHRSMTIVIAKERTPEAIKEALFARRTMVFYDNLLIGEEQYLKPVFNASVTAIRPSLKLKGKERGYLQLRNTSGLDLEIEVQQVPAELAIPKNVILQHGKVTLCEVKSPAGNLTGTRKFSVPCVVKNLLVEPGKGLPVTIEFEVTFNR